MTIDRGLIDTALLGAYGSSPLINTASKKRPQLLSYGLISLYLNTLLIIYKKRQEKFLSNPF